MNGINNIGTSPIQENLAQPASESAPIQGGEVPQSVQPGNINQRIEEGRRDIGQQPLASLGPHISASKAALEQAVAQLGSTLPEDRKALPPTFGVTIPPHGRSIQIDAKMVRHELAGLSGDQRLQAVQDMQRTLQERIRHGYELRQGVTNGTLGGPAGVEDVRDLATFFMAKAAEKGAAFSDGAFNIEDPGHRLRNFLDSCPEMYQRASSHIDGFQQGDGGGHRGIDIQGLPHGMGTVLYGAMNDGVQGMTGDRLFLKLEEHGCRLTSGLAPHRDPNVHEDRPLRFFRDVRQTLGHAVGFIRTCLRNISGGRLFADSPDSRKERIPSDVARDYTNMIRNFENREPDGLAEILKQNDPTSKAGGIRVMAKNLDQALEHPDLSVEQRTVLRELKYNLSARFDHLEVRIGNEVVLNADELSGEDPQQAMNSQARAMMTSLLDVPADGFTPDRVQKFVGQLAQIGLHLDLAADVDPGNRMMSNALNPALISLSSEEMSRLRNLLNSSQCREAMGAALDVMSLGAENLGPMDSSAQASAGQIARKIYYMYSVMRAGVGLPDEILPSTDEGLNTIKPLLVRAGTDAFLSQANLAVMTNEAGIQEHRTLQAGAMPLSEVRRLIGREETALGDYMRSIDRGSVDREQIGRTLLDGVMRDVGRADLDNGPGGLNARFVDGLLRDGVRVGANLYGGQGTNIPPAEQEQQIRAFIDAVGGLDKARQIARVAHQGLEDLMTTAADADPGFGPLLGAFNAYDSLEGRVLVPRPTISITVHGEEAGIRFEHSEQRVGGRTDGIPMEMGRNISLDITLHGLGTGDPAVRLDSWDMLYSSCPQQRITDMDQNLLWNMLGENEFCLDVHLREIQNGEPDRRAISRRLTEELGVELRKARAPGYGGLPQEFINDIFRRAVTVNGQPFGGGGTAHLPQAEQERMLNDFITALGGDETRAARIANMAFQNIPGVFLQALMFNPALGPLETALLMHPDAGTIDQAEFTITTLDNGDVRLHLDFSQQRGARDGLEMGKTGYLDYTLTDLDTNSPQVRLDGWRMIYGSNRVPNP